VARTYSRRSRGTNACSGDAVDDGQLFMNQGVSLEILSGNRNVNKFKFVSRINWLAGVQVNEGFRFESTID
jgi:hypothetical protein